MADKIAIITDSCSDVPKELIEKYNIFMLPMLITCEDGQYKDGVDITVEEVYEKIKTAIKNVGTAGQYTYIFETSAALFVGAGSKDLTNEIKAEINRLK